MRSVGRAGLGRCRALGGPGGGDKRLGARRGGSCTLGGSRVPGRGPGSLCWPLTSVRRSSFSADSRSLSGFPMETHPLLAPPGRWGW